MRPSSRVLSATRPIIIPQRHVSRFTVEKAMKWVPSAAGWCVAAGAALLLLGEKVPLVRKDILEKLPILGDYYDYQKNLIPASDKPY